MESRSIHMVGRSIHMGGWSIHMVGWSIHIANMCIHMVGMYIHTVGPKSSLLCEGSLDQSSSPALEVDNVDTKVQLYIPWWCFLSCSRKPPN